ncbi:MAG TPA: HlyD family efflux transporter periplasmic adaptor subunit [Alphaproteobacteria bacterium]
MDFRRAVPPLPPPGPGRRTGAPVRVVTPNALFRPVAAAGLAVVFALAACDDGVPRPTFQGYVEAPPVLVGPEEGGRLVKLAVDEGDQVAAGALVFVVDQTIYEAEVAATRARFAEAEARLADLRAQQQRPEEIDVIEARRRRAEADLALARQELERQRELFGRGVSPKARLDQAEATYQRDMAALQEITRQIEAARLTARTHEIAAAEAAVTAARAALEQAETRLARRTVLAPVAGVVQQVLFRPGEVVAAGQPVVTLQSPERRRVRFFVPEPRRADLRIGASVAVTCDRCPPDLRARISFISPEAEFTPPVIFSLDERAKLVYLIEAVPEGAARELLPGQPVTVHPLPGEAS